MKYVLTFSLALVLGCALFPQQTEAAQQRVAIRISGKYCMFHAFELERALKRVSGVIGLDFETMRGNVIVLMRPGKVNPDQLLAAFQEVKGEGYSCKGEFNGEPGKVEY